MTIWLVKTCRIQDAIEDVLRLNSVPEDFCHELRRWRKQDEKQVDEIENDVVGKFQDIPIGGDNVIPFKIVKRMFELLKEAGSVIYLNELLEGSELYFKPINEPAKSPELVARLEKLQAKQDQLRYRAMVKDIDKELIHKNKKELAFEVRSTSRQLSSVVNFSLSVAGTFVFGFMSSQFAFTNIGLRVMFGIILASIVALAELYFMARTEI